MARGKCQRADTGGREKVDKICDTTKRVQMASPARKSAKENARQRRHWHRLRILTALVAICRDLERLQTTAAAKEACREVEARLARLTFQERRLASLGGR